ncbi:MAG: HDOD domain-containing protein, partial [Candidatus Riflebacteria bacterium]|nr:HDOD domain-containing protein [Candidatus Riflebacteria bacterium]
MSENINNTFPFQLKLYQNKLPEVIIKDTIVAGHKVLPSLQTLMEKFPIVLLELQYPGKLKADTQEFFQKLDKPEKLIVLIDNANQVEFDMSPIPVLPSLQSALLRLKHKPGIEAAVKQISSFPEMHSPVFEYLKFLQDDSLDFQNIVDELNKNSEISKRILKICNSMERAISNPFDNLARAVSFVGVEGVRQILIEEAFSILTFIFRNQRDKLCHLRRASTLAGMLGNLYGTNPHIFWRMRSAALMHDIGSLVMAYYNPTEAERCYNVSRAKKITTCDAENIYFGYNHQEAGLLMAKVMNLPEYLYPAITKHHYNQIDPEDILLQATVIANGFINHESEAIGFNDYEDSIDFLEDSKEAADQERLDKEFAKRSARLAPDDYEGRKKLEEEIYG